MEPFFPSTRASIPGRFSPDGSQVAFTSNRGSTNWNLWIADIEGSDPLQMAEVGLNSELLAYAWSPDGKKILLESAANGDRDVYVVSLEEERPVRLTNSPVLEGAAEWSRDGRWIYFTAMTSETSSDIWRMPATGGDAEEFIAGGFEPQESPDGEFLYYVDRVPKGRPLRLLRIPTSGGEAEIVHQTVRAFQWSVTNIGIYFLQDEDYGHSILLYHFADGHISRIGSLPFYLPSVDYPGRFSVSPDGHWALVNVKDEPEGDLMFVDDFH